MYIVYILSSSKFLKTYVGYASDLEKRIRSHNSGKVFATRLYKPWHIIYTESLNSIFDAKKRERYWKSGSGRRNIKNILSGFPPRFKSGRGSPK